jgi:hypothetical protein
MVVALLGASAGTCAEQRFSAGFSALADDENGRSLDVDTTLAARDWLTLGAGLGSTRSDTVSGPLEGTSFRASADLHSERLGVRGYYRNWHSQGVDTDTLGMRGYFTQNNLTVSILGESRGLDVDHSVEASTTGWGAGASYQWSHWSAYAEGVAYRYGALSRYVPAPSAQTSGSSSATPTSGASGLPTLPIAPALPGPAGAIGSDLPTLGQALSHQVPTLAGSFVTLNQGVFDHVLSAGLERAFSRASLRFDWTGAKDAVLGTNLNSFSAGYRYVFTPRLAGGLTLGTTESRYGSISFGGLSFGVTL